MSDMVDDFAVSHPKATVEEWKEFARACMVDGERRGYAMGYEMALRSEDADPEALADVLTPGWRDSPAVDPADPGSLAVDAMILNDSRDYGGG